MKRTAAVVLVAALFAAVSVAAQEKPKPPTAPAVNPRLPKPAQAEQLSFRAEELQSKGKFAEAAALMQQAAELVTDDWLLWNRTGWAHLDAGQAAPALKAFESAKKAAPPGTPLEGGFIITQFALGDQTALGDLIRRTAPGAVVERAKAVVAKGLAAKPRSADWNFALGYLYARVIGNSSRALDPMEAVVAVEPKNAEAWLILVEANQALNRGPQEDAAAVKYLELAPETPDAYRLRASRFAELMNYRDAIAEYEAGVAKHPLEAELYYQLARVHERAGGAKNAEGVYRKLIALAVERKLEGTAVQARMQLANFHARQRNYVEAEAHYRAAAAGTDATVTTWNTWAALLALTAKWPEAAKALETAAARDEKERPSTSASVRDEQLAARYHAAVCRLAAGQRDLAKTGLLAALQVKSEARTSPEMEVAAFLAWLEPKPDSAQRLAYQRSDERWARFTWRREPEEGELEVRGRFSPAATGWRAILQQVQKLNPTCWPADYALGRIYAAAGFTDEGLRLLGRASQAQPPWWAPYYAMGEYYARNGNKEKGIPLLTRTLQLAPANRQARVSLSLLSGVKSTDDFDLDKDQ